MNNQLFSFGEEKILTNNFSSDTSDLQVSIKNIQMLPISKEEKELMIANEVKLFNLKRKTQSEEMIEISNLIGVKRKITEIIFYLLNLQFEDINEKNAHTIYSKLRVLVKFLKYKKDNLKQNNNIIHFKETTYKRDTSSLISFDRCEDLLAGNIIEEIIRIDLKEKKGISYSVVKEIFNITAALNGYVLEILTDTFLSKEYFGFLTEQEIKTFKSFIDEQKETKE